MNIPLYCNHKGQDRASHIKFLLDFDPLLIPWYCRNVQVTSAKHAVYRSSHLSEETLRRSYARGQASRVPAFLPSSCRRNSTTKVRLQETLLFSLLTNSVARTWHIAHGS